MRDLRSIIAWMLTRDYTCADMPHLIELLDKAKENTTRHRKMRLTRKRIIAESDMNLNGKGGGRAIIST